MATHKLLEDLESHFETMGAIRNLAQECNQKLIDFLLKDSQYSNEYRSRFFLETSGVLIFKQLDFLTFLDLKNLGGSFTSYASKIGLSSKTRGLLKASNEVVLNFAYKDGVLKGGQSRDEQKSQEIFFNEILAKDEIDVLFEPKALRNFEVIGDKKIDQLVAEESNLLLKGNNLLALHSLKKKYQGKVKLIYIDPPYNTGNDSFKYNDKFNHSTWLTFMKNRLEVAKEFLRDDGVIFVQCDDNEQAYLKVLMDEIFGRENFIAALFVLNNLKGNYNTDYFAEVGEYLLVYARDKKAFRVYDLIVDDDEELEKWKRDNIGFWKIGRELKATGENAPKEKRPTMFFPLYISDDNDFSLEKSDKYHLEVYPIRNGKEVCWNWSKQQFIKCKDEVLIFRDKNNKITVKKKQRPEFDNLISKKPKNIFYRPSYSNTVSAKHIEELFREKIFLYSKSEALLKDIIEISTQENDLIIDFFAGSGTTLAVAHKMGRRWIGIEQMDYIESITKERIKKVIDGEQGGISKAIEWKGGGSFIYAELMPLNTLYREKLKSSQNEKELERTYKDLEEKAFLDYRVDLQEILKDQDFENMHLEDKKNTLRLILDENMDYVPFRDIEDKTYGIDGETIKLNKMFYGEK